MQVDLSKWFAGYLDRLSEDDYDKIDNFIQHVETYGLIGLKGANRKSDRVNQNSETAKADEEFAQKYNLWHYHIGIPKYDMTKGFGKYTSDFYLHYERYPERIRIVGMNDHKPFELPIQKMIENHK